MTGVVPEAGSGLVEASGGTVRWLPVPGGVRLRIAHWPAGRGGAAWCCC